MGSRHAHAPEEFYHIYNRGTEKRKIFLSNADRDRFLTLLYLANGSKPVRLENIRRNEQGRTLLKAAFEVDRGEPLVDIAAYCLMPNHFHLLLRQRDESGISSFLQKLLTGYTMYFNLKNDRSGTLFEGRSKSKHAGEDTYLKYLISYIHLNPIKLVEPRWKEIGLHNNRNARELLRTYRYSSFADYASQQRIEGRIVNREAFPYPMTPEEFKREVFEWLEYGNSEYLIK